MLLAPAAAAQVTVHAFTDRTTMGDDEVLLYTIEASGDFDAVGQVTPPETRGLVAVQTRPVQNWSVMSVNSRKRQKLALQWQYRAIGTNQASIGSAAVVLDGRTYTTASITVAVVPQSQRPSVPTWVPSPTASPRVDDAAPSDLFLRAEPGEVTAWVGEQVVIDYMLYFEPDVLPRNSRIASAWDADGFWREEMELDRFSTPRVTPVGGRTFEAAPIKRMALFPTRSGRLVVDSLDIEADVLRATRLGPPGSPRSFLYNSFGSQFERETLTAPPVVVTVRPLPSGAPSTFAGAVGQFGLAVESDAREVQAGEPFRVTATVSGQGNIATLEAPTWATPPVFEQYPVREAERIERTADVIRGEKAFTYTLVPRSGGRFTLPPVEWTYFEPNAGKYRTLRSDSLRLRVIGPAAPLAEAAPKADPDALIAPPAEATWERARPAVPFYARPWVWTAFGLPALALLGLLAVRRHRDRDDDSPHARSLRAFPAAERGLRDAAALLDRGDTRAFYAALDRTLRLFLSDRLGTPTHGLAHADIADLLAERGVTPETRAATLDLLGESDAAQFAPIPSASPADATDRAARLMAAVDAEAHALAPSL